MTENLEQIQKLDEKIMQTEEELEKTQIQALKLKKEIEDTEKKLQIELK